MKDPVEGTQNDTKLSPLASLVYEQARRQVKSFCCFNCGGSHFAKNCKQKKRGLTLTCPSCKSEIVMTSKGQTVTSVPAPQGTKRSASECHGSASKAAKIDVAKSSGSPCPTTKFAKVDAAVAISICGQHYTSLSWFLSKENPSPSLCKRARENCSENALVLLGGHTLLALWEIFNFNSDPKDFILPPRPGRMRVGRRARDKGFPSLVTCMRVSRRARDKGFPWLVTCHHSRSVLWTQNVFENNGRRKLDDWALLQNSTLLTECIFGDGFPKHGFPKLENHQKN